MGDYKLKVKIGQHEFEAEGPQEAVEKQFAAFSDLISKTLAAVPTKTPVTRAQSPGAPEGMDIVIDPAVAKIFRADTKMLSLSALPSGEDRELDSVLLILYGHKALKATDLVSADDLLNGLKQSGITVERADRLARRAESKGFVNKSGVRRGVKYRLTNPGLARALDLASALASSMP